MKRQPKTKNSEASCRQKRQAGNSLKVDGAYHQHIKELIRAWEQDGQHWAIEMKSFLETLRTVVANAGGALNANRGKRYRVQYRKLIKKGKIECLEPAQFLKKGKGKRIKKSRSQDLLDRLQENEDQILMFTET